MDAFTKRKALEQIRRLSAVRKAKPRKPAPRMRHPDHIALSYYAGLLGLLAGMRQVEGPLLRACKDAAARDDAACRSDADKPGTGAMREAVRKAQAAFERKMDARLGALKRIAERAGKATGDFNRGQLIAQAKAQIGITLPFADIDKAMLKSWQRENIALVKTVPERYFGSLMKRVDRYASTGMRPETLAANIPARWGVAKSDLARIARDQVSKLNGQVNVARLKDAGVRRGIWRTMRDNRVRDTHDHLEGESFDLDSPPKEGIPGEEIQCRCYFEPDFRSSKLFAAAA